MDLSDVLAKKRPTTGTVRIVMDPALSDAYHEAVSTLEEAKVSLAVAPDDRAAAKAVRQAKDALAVAEDVLLPELVDFVQKALGKHDYESLKDEHLPTEAQIERSKTVPSLIVSQLYANPDTFPPALVAACSVDPVITPDEAEAMWKSPDWNDGELDDLFWGAQRLQRSRRIPDLGKGSGPTRS